MPFRDPIVAGVTLVRDAIQSRNFVHLTSGWSINSDGTAEFSNVIIVGGSLQSANYVAGVSGYKLDGTTGTAEVNQLTARGTVEVGTAGGQRLDLKTSLGIPRIELYPNNGETQPAFVAGLTTAQGGSGSPLLELDSPNMGAGVTLVQIVSPPAAGTTPGSVFITGSNSTPAGVPATIVNLDAGVVLFCQNTHDLSLTSTNHAITIGATSGANLGIDNNEIMARNNGTAAGLFLNNDGGLVGIGTGTATGNLQIGPTASANLNANFNQIWALNNGAASGLFLNFSSAGTVQIGDGTAAGAAMACVAMRDLQQRDTTAHAGFIGTTFTALSTISIAAVCPPSGFLVIHVSATVTPTAALVTNSFVLSVDVTNTTQGTNPHGPSDNDSAQVFAIAANGSITIQRTIAVPSCGNAGDALVITPQCRVTGGNWTLQRTWLVVQPSM